MIQETQKYRALRRPRNTRSRRGAALIEMTIVVFTLALMLFGICEMGLLFRDQATLANAAREGARSLSIGDTTSTAKTRAINFAKAANLDLSNIPASNWVMQTSADGSTNWTTITDGTSTNNAKSGSYVRMQITYTHNWLTNFWGSSTGKNIVVLVCMRRE